MRLLLVGHVHGRCTLVRLFCSPVMQTHIDELRTIVQVEATAYKAYLDFHYGVTALGWCHDPPPLVAHIKLAKHKN